MGCALSGTSVEPDSAACEEKRSPSLGGGLGLETDPVLGDDDEEPRESFSLSGPQKDLIRASWEVLHKDIARVGVIVFISKHVDGVFPGASTPLWVPVDDSFCSQLVSMFNYGDPPEAIEMLFETHPECKDAFFLFRDVDDFQQLKMSTELQAHGLRVMSFIEKSVARLDQEDKLEHLAFELGRSHARYKAPPKYYEYVGTQFIQAVQPMLKEGWTPDVEKAWENLFKYLVAMMRRGFHTEDKMRASPSLHTRRAGGGSTPKRI